MAIDTKNSWQEFTADGKTAYFTFNFNYTDELEIVVGMRTGENKFETVEPSNYQVIKNVSEDGGQIRFTQNPSGSETIDKDIPAGTVIRIERRSSLTSSASWQLGLEMTQMVALFDRLFRLAQENKGRFDNVVKTFETQHGIKLYELLEEHQDKMFFWDNEKKTITPTKFPYQDVVQCVDGLYLRIRSDVETQAHWLEWSKTGDDPWYSSKGYMDYAVKEAKEAKSLANQAVNTANSAEDIANQAKADAETAVETSNQALDIANKANETANNANAKSDNAVESANKAVETSNQANATSEQARDIAATANTTADAAKQNADAVLGVAQNAESIAGEAKTTAESAAAAAAAATATANDAKTTAQGIASTAQNALDVANQANATATDAASQAAGAVEKADNAKAAADAVVDTANQAKQAADDALAKVDAKADKADLDADYKDLDGRITSLQALAAESYELKTDAESKRATLQDEIDTKAGKTTDFITPVTTYNKGATKNEVDKLESKIDIAGTSGKIIGSYWFGKTKAETVVPAPTMIGQNYYDFTTGNIYKSNDGTTWELTGTNIPPADIDAQIIISSQFWDIPEQENQHGGKAWWSHTNKEWSYSPVIYEEKQGGAGSGYHNGDVFFTMRLDDLDGAVPAIGLQYNLSDINGGNNNLQELLTQGKLPYVSIAQHTATVSQYGSCRAFGWDGGDVIVVPKLNDVYIKAGDAATPDEFLAESLPNITGQASFYGTEEEYCSAGGAFYKATSVVPYGKGHTQSPGLTLGLDASRSSKAYKTGAKVQPDSVRYRAMVQLFNGVTDEAVATCTSVLTDVAELKEKVAIAFAAGGRYLVRKKVPTANDLSWYNVYSDGWVEQGSIIPKEQSTIKTIVFPVPMASSLYNWTLGVSMHGENESTYWNIACWDFTPTSMTARCHTEANKCWQVMGYANPSEYTRDKWGDDTDYSTISVMTGDPSPFKFKAWTNAGGETVYTLLAVPIARGDDMYTEDQLAVYNEWDANQSTAPLPKVEDRCGAIGIVNGNRAINGGGVQMGTPGELDATTAYVRNQALDTNG